MQDFYQSKLVGFTGIGLVVLVFQISDLKAVVFQLSGCDCHGVAGADGGSPACMCAYARHAPYLATTASRPN